MLRPGAAHGAGDLAVFAGYGRHHGRQCHQSRTETKGQQSFELQHDESELMCCRQSNARERLMPYRSLD